MTTEEYNKLNSSFDDAMKALENLATLEPEPTKEEAKWEKVVPVMEDGKQIFPYFHKSSNGDIFDVRGVSTKYPKMDSNHLRNTIKYLKGNGTHHSKIRMYEEEQSRRIRKMTLENV